MPNKNKTKPKDTVEDALELEIRAQLEVIAKKRLAASRKKGGDYDKDLALSTAALVRAQVGIENEKRQRQKAERRALESFSIEQILDYLRTQPAEVQADVARELGGDMAEEPLL